MPTARNRCSRAGQVTALALSSAVALAACGERERPSGVARAKRGSVAPATETLAGSWWNWAAKRPDGQDPVTDKTGHRCGQDQPRDVFFLAGTYGGRVTRACRVPRGRALFFPVLNQTCSSKDPSAPEAAVECGRGVRGARTALSVDGQRVHVRYVVSKPYELRPHPRSNQSGLAGPNIAVGYHALLPALPPGRHVVRFAGARRDGFSLKVVYRLAVG